MTAQEQEKDQGSIKRIFRTETSFLLIGFVLLWFVFYKYFKGGPVSTDVIYYFNLGQLKVADPFVLNRYFHIYLQKLFVDLAQNPLSGMQSMWACILSAITIGTYLLARLITPASTPLHGIIAVGMLLSIKSIPITAGVPYADLTVTFMSVALVILWLLFLRSTKMQAGLLIFIGIITYLGFKTKEIFLSTAVVLIGIFIVNDRINLKEGSRRSVNILLGMFIGVVFFQLAHAIVLGNPLFGLRSQDYQIFNETYATRFLSMSLNTAHANPYGNFIYLFLAIPFAFYLIGVSSQKHIDLPSRIVWGIPLFYIGLMVYLLKYREFYNHRFFLPLLPFLCAFGIQFIPFGSHAEPNNLKSLTKYLLIGFLGALLMYGLKRIIVQSGQDSALYMDVVILPITLTLLFIVQLIINKGIIKSMLLTALTIALLLPPFIDNVRELVIDQQNYKVFTQAASPLYDLGKAIEIQPETKVAIEQKAVLTDAVAFYKDKNEISALYNLVNDTFTTKSNFVFLVSESDIAEIGLCGSQYDYYLISQNSWDSINVTDCLGSTYRIEKQINSGLILLSSK